MVQAKTVSKLLKDQGCETEIISIQTSGDRGDRFVLGAFVREIQQSLLEGNIDVALHCLKDLPTTPVQGLVLGAYLKREDARDALISPHASLSDLPMNAVIGTGSLRRTSQMALQRSDVSFKPLIGNVDTRMRKLVQGEYDAIVLAMAGLMRLGWLESWSVSDYRGLIISPLSVDVMVPSPGQGVLVLETREADADTLDAISVVHHEPTAQASKSERAFLATFGGGCSVPVGAYGVFGENGLNLTGCVVSPDAARHKRGSNEAEGRSPEEQGEALAQQLDAFDIVREVLGAR